MARKRKKAETEIIENLETEGCVQTDSGRKPEIFGLLIIAAAFYLYASLLGLSVGSVGIFMRNCLTYGLGHAAGVAPLMLLLWGGALFLKKRNLFFSRATLGALILLVALAGLLHHIFVPVGSELTPHLLPQGGGLLGGVTLSFLRKAFGNIGALLVLLLLIFASLYLTTKFTLAGKAQHVGKTAAGTIALSLGARVKNLLSGASSQNAKNNGAYADEPDDYDGNEIRIAARRNETPFDVYDKEEFADFTGDMQKPGIFTRLFGYAKRKQSADKTSAAGVGEKQQEHNAQPELRSKYVGSVEAKTGQNDTDFSDAAGCSGTSQGVKFKRWDYASGSAGDYDRPLVPGNSLRKGSVRLVELHEDVQEPCVLRPAAAELGNASQKNFSADDSADNLEKNVPNYSCEEKSAESKTKNYFHSESTENFSVQESSRGLSAGAWKTNPSQGNSGLNESLAEADESYDKSTSKIMSAGAKDEIPSTATQQTEIEFFPSKSEAAAENISEAHIDENGYALPPVEILNPPRHADAGRYRAEIAQQSDALIQTLQDFKVNATVIGATRGPTVTRFEIKPGKGVKVNQIVNLADDIALNLAASGVRIEAPIPGKAAVGIEAPNRTNETVCFREVVDTPAVRSNPSKLCVGLGRDIAGNVITCDLGKMPHILIAGSTGSGKSVCVNTIIAGLLYRARPDEVKFILVDPKVVELTNYNGIPHLLVPVVTDPKKAAAALHWAVQEMERRYQSFADHHVRDIKTFNAKAEGKTENMPFIVIIIDELSDLMMVAKNDVEDAILRLAQKARACGIHLVIATQRPSVDVITGIVKANIPSRIAFAVASQIDSRTILDGPGADKLLGKGDMLYAPLGEAKPIRVQGAFVTDEELALIVEHVKAQGIEAKYSDEVTETELPSDQETQENISEDAKSISARDPYNTLLNDEHCEAAIRLVLDLGQASASMLQRRFRMGYNHAARFVDCLEQLGVVGPSVGSKPRQLIMKREQVEEMFFGDNTSV